MFNRLWNWLDSFVTYKEIEDIANPTDVYLRRWSLWLPLGYSIKLHEILRSDADRCLHDHPWWMLRVILKGGYTEVVGDDPRPRRRKPWRPWAPWRVFFSGAKFKHRITELHGRSSWTLALMGRKHFTADGGDDWAFYTKQGRVHWRHFISNLFTVRVMWCDDGRAINGTTKGDDYGRKRRGDVGSGGPGSDEQFVGRGNGNGDGDQAGTARYPVRSELAN